MTLGSSTPALGAVVLLALSTLLIGRWRAWEPGAADEAYVWYGTLRLLEGKVPVRDFRSYEPGRYLWSAPFVLAFGKGVQSIRLASWTFYALCLLFSGQAFMALGVSLPGLAILLITAIGTVREIYKLYEPGFAWIWIAVAALSLASPTANQGALLGGVFGLAAVFGLNLALYTSAASCVVLIWLWLHQQLTLPFLLAATGGLTIGLGPLILYCLIAQGFLRAVIQRRISTIIRRGTTNLPLPIPFPWRKGAWAGEKKKVLHRLWLGFSFLVLPTLPPLTLAMLIAQPAFMNSTDQVVLFAAACLGLFAWHHAFSRADEWHLYQSHVPALILAVLWLEKTKPGLMLLLIWLSLAIWFYLRDLKSRMLRRFNRQWNTGGCMIVLHESSNQIIECIDSELKRTSTDAQDWLLAVPFTLWLLPILGCRSPVYDIFCVYPANEEGQNLMIAELAGNPFEAAVIDNSALDGREDLRFSRTHPKVWAWLNKNFVKVECSLPPNLELLRRYRQ
jgi:hypothetical protein